MDITAAKSSAQAATSAKDVNRPWNVRVNNSNTLDVQARKFVAQYFYGTMFKQMRTSTMGTGLFDGGSGGKSFQTMLDQRMAENMSNAPAGRMIAENLVKSIQKNKRDPSLPNSLDEARRKQISSPRTIRKALDSSAASESATHATPSLDMKG